MSDYLKIKYRNSCDLGGAVFQQPCNAFWFTLYLPVDVGKSTFELIEEGREDGDKNFISDFKKLTKTYEFTTVVAEYMLDALAAIALHDTIYITLKNDEVSRVFNFKVNNNGWNDKGGEVNVTVQFTVRYDLTTGCCGNEKISYHACYSCNTRITPEDWVDINSLATTQYEDRDWLMAGYPDIDTGEYFVNKLYRYRYSNSYLQSRDNIAGVVGGYTEYTGRDLELICFTHNSVAVKFYYKDGYWRPCLFIRDIEVSGTSATVRAWMLPDTFAQLYHSPDGITYTAVGSPVLAGTMQNSGVTKTGCPAGVNYFKVLFYDNNCEYGYSTVVTQSI